MTEHDTGPAGRIWWPWLAFGLATFALLFRPLLGLGALLPTDIAELFAPWRYSPTSGHEQLQNPLLSDTLDVHSHFASMASDLRNGGWAFWDRSVGGGIPIMKAGLPVFNWVYLMVPAWYAPGLAAAARTMTAAGLTFGLTRRLGLSRSAATISGVAYAFCGFLIGWSGWPQANVAALVPGVFWLVEAMVDRPRLRQSVGLGVVVAAMVWSNFPVITVYGLLFGAGYAIYRLWATRSPRGERARWAHAVMVASWGGVLAVGAAAYHVLHFGENLAWADTGSRERLPADTSIGAEYMPGLLLPAPFGANHDGQTFWGPGQNWVESQSYAGVAVIVLALLSFGHRTRRRGGSPTSMGGVVRAWWVIVVLALWLTYVGGPLTDVVNSLPAVGYSTVGRARVVANLGLAVLAGFGVEAWLRHRAGHIDVDLRAGLRHAGMRVVIVGVVTSPFVLSWLRITRDAGFLKELAADAVVPTLAGVVALALLGWFGSAQRAATVALPLITAVVAGELLLGLGSYSTVVDPDSVDLSTDAHLAAIDALGPGERMSAEGRVFIANSGQTTGLDDLRTNGFLPPGWREVYRALDADHFRPPGTVANPYFTDVDIGSEALARLGIGVWAMTPTSPAHGPRIDLPVASGEVALDGTVDGSNIGIVPGGGLRAVTIDVLEPASGLVSVDVTAGGITTTGRARIDGATGSIDVVFVDDELIAGTPFTARFSFTPADGSAAPILRGEGGRITFGTVAGGDGWRVVWAGDVVLYDRVEPVGVRLAHAARDVDAVRSNDHLASRSTALVAPGVAVELGLPAAPPEAIDATATVVAAAGDETVIEVDSSHPALVVLPNPDYPGWSATVNGEPTEIIRVDDSFQAVLVPAGASTVEMGFQPSYLWLATMVAALTGAALVLTWRLGDRLDARWRNSVTTG
ncbi:MAG: YfhO family protein [Actinomycetota bacterium]